MKKILTLIFLLAFIPTAYAGHHKGHGNLDRIVFKLAAEQWVTTKTAKVTVSVDATLDNTGLAKMRNMILGKLNHIAKGEWHITQFVRSQDSSGLEKLRIRAEARLPEKALAGLNVNAKSVSKPGETYRVDNVDFTPSLVEFEQARDNLRNEIYKKVKTELANVNKLYAEPKYVIHMVNFLPSWGKKRKQGATRMLEMRAAAPATSGIAVSNKLIVKAKVVLAVRHDDN